MTTVWKQTDDGFVASRLQAFPDLPAGDEDHPNATDADFRIVPFRDGARPSHVLIAAAKVPVRVNGSFVVGGLRVLQHKDEIVVSSQRMFFSAESAPVVEVYQHDGSPRRPRCAVCRAEIQERQPVVRCPGCSRLYHQIEATLEAAEKPCWTYSPACRFCDHPTSMSGEPTWRPDEEG